jgi:uncharacterized protein (UPF0335 family)
MNNPFKKEKSVEVELDWLVEMLLGFVERLEEEMEELRNDLDDLVQTLEADFD